MMESFGVLAIFISFAFKVLASDSQSPIAIWDNAVTRRSSPSLIFGRYSREYEVEISNNGYDVKIHFHSSSAPFIYGGGLYSVYKLDNIHFHYESEHTINGYRYPLEAHFVHYKTLYGSVENALNFKDGIVVLTVLYNLKTTFVQSAGFSSISGSTPRTTEDVNSIVITPSQFLPDNFAEFYTYSGSLTTPDYNEPVTFIILRDAGWLSVSQYIDFTYIRDANGNIIRSNYRSLQPLNGRNVYLNVVGNGNAIVLNQVSYELENDDVF